MSESPTAEPGTRRTRAGETDVPSTARSARPLARPAEYALKLRITIDPAEPPVPPFVMDRPVLHAVVRELVEDERVAAFVDALPARARVSEAALPPLLATLHEKLERGLVVLLPEDADARDTADAVAWFLGDDAVGLLTEPRRLVRVGARAAAAPRRRARPRAPRSRARWARLRVGARARGGTGAGRRASRSGRGAARARAGRRRARRVARARRLRARRASRRPRAVRGARRHRRRLPDDRPRAAARRVLRRRDRVGARVLAVHAARPPPGRGGDALSRRPSGASTSSSRRSPTTTSRRPSPTISSRRSPARPTSSSSPMPFAACGRRTASATRRRSRA